MNVTLSIDEGLLQRARRLAESMGTSVNQLIRDYLEELTSQSDVESEIAELRRLSTEAGGDRKGWTFDRDEIHGRP